MEGPLKEWRDKVLYSMIPVAVAVGTILYGNSLIEALGEGYSIFLYFIVVLAVEIDTVFTLRPGQGSGTRSGNSAQVVVVAILWFAFVVSRSLTGSSPTSFPYSLLFIAALGSLASIWILRTHRKKTVEQYEQRNIAQEIKENEKKEFDRLKKKPKNPRIGEKKLDTGK